MILQNVPCRQETSKTSKILSTLLVMFLHRTSDPCFSQKKETKATLKKTNPDNPYPLNEGGGSSPPLLRAWGSTKHYETTVQPPPPLIEGVNIHPLKLQGYGLSERVFRTAEPLKSLEKKGKHTHTHTLDSDLGIGRGDSSNFLAVCQSYPQYSGKKKAHKHKLFCPVGPSVHRICPRDKPSLSPGQIR